MQQRLGRTTVLFALAGILWLLPGVFRPAEAVVLYSKNEALRLIFPEADSIEPEAVFLNAEQVARIEKLARSQLESPLLTVHVGRKGDETLGYAFLDIHTVRTQPEALFVVLTPQGTVDSVLIVAFHEPQGYMPSERWQAQFPGKTLTPDLQVRRGIAPISGATLSAHAMTDAVRRALAVYQVALQKDRP
jgi:transcriptional regulator of nitric oxide reductase